MVCIYCDGKTSVSNSRANKAATWRRRTCLDCAAVFTTYETADLASAIRVNLNGRLEPFKQHKLMMSIYESIKHRIGALDDAQHLSWTITQQLVQSQKTGVLKRTGIINESLKSLHAFDQTAAAVYKATHSESQ